MVVAEPLIRALFMQGKFTEDNVAITASVLIFYCIGIIGYSQQQVLNRGMYALRDSKRAVIVNCTIIIINIVLSFLMVGPFKAQGLALARGVPFVRTTHQQGHIAASLLSAAGASLFARRVLVFHISGGTTELLLCSGTSVVCRVGGSTDLYAGQAVDRIGVKLGFAFPAGAELSILASECSEEIKPKVSVKGADCSFSGLENQCAALLERGAAPAYVAKYCLSAVGQTVLRMICAAQEQYPGVPVVCAGGVMSSDIIRAYVQRTQPDIYFVPGRYSSDNAIGVAVLAAKEVQAWPM